MITNLRVGGLRGLATEQTLEFAIPDGQPGSGLTVLVGTNNSGKSTVVEALRVLAQGTTPNFPQGMRNTAFGDQVSIRLGLKDGSDSRISSLRAGGAQSERFPPAEIGDLLVVPSRRTFEPQFGETSGSRHAYASSTQVSQLRSATLNNFAQRLFDLDRNPEQRKHFDELIAQVIGYAPNWTIDLNDSGNFFLKFVWDGAAGSLRHSSEGLGDGLISLIVILDAIRDTEPGSTVVIDEPELSLHPQYQRRLRALLSANATDRQIVYATHSPYFIDWSDVAAGAQIIRVHKTGHGTSVASPSRAALEAVLKLGSSNLNNPHVLGLNANEVFFLEGGIVLAEGQEDVVLLPKVLDDVGIDIHGSFFGWGVGGAENMRAITRLLQELGYPLVAGVLDQDKASLAAELALEFPDYRFACIPTDDVRDKPARSEQAAKTGLMGSDRAVRTEYRGAVTSMFQDIKTYFASGEGLEIV